MAKSKKFKSNAEGPGEVAVGGRSATISFAPGETYETSDEAEIAALSANPDISEVKSDSKKKS